MRCWYADILYVIVMNIINKLPLVSLVQLSIYTYQAAETCFSLSGLSNNAKQHYSHYSYQSCQIRAEA